MTYQVLARKWRPQDFSSIVGQDPIITALRNGLKDNRIAQAYLFSGIRGVGKTTAARVLAKALNCERVSEGERATGDPCNECRTCTEITAGSDLDVLEVDAATYSKVEQVRELTESLRYGPARDRYKVVVLDEVHRLSRQAFDALLKIVEEPPPHLVFIFATTESDAVPATILSRCQEFQFRRVPSPVLAKHLRRLSDAEGIEVSDPALRMIARAGEGSVRDSVALLDQLATFGNSEISDHDASNLLGGLDAAIFLRVLGAILDGDSTTVTETVREIESHGWDPHNVFGQFLIYSRDALHLAIGGQPDTIDLPLEEAEALADLVRSQSYENLLRLSDHMLTSEPIVRRSEFALLALELAWLRAAELPKLTRIEDLLSGNAPAEIPEQRPAPANRSNVRKATARSTTATLQRSQDRDSRAHDSHRDPAQATPHAITPPETSPERLTEPPVQQPASPVASNSPPKPGPPINPTLNQINAFREAINTRSQPLAALIDPAKLEFEAGQLLIYPPAGDTLVSSALQRKKNAALFDELTQSLYGDNVTWAIRETPAESKSKQNTGASLKANAEEAEKDPIVRTVLDVFGGNIQTIQPQANRETNS